MAGRAADRPPRALLELGARHALRQTVLSTSMQWRQAALGPHTSTTPRAKPMERDIGDEPFAMMAACLDCLQPPSCVRPLSRLVPASRRTWRHRVSLRDPRSDATLRRPCSRTLSSRLHRAQSVRFRSALFASDCPWTTTDLQNRIATLLRIALPTVAGSLTIKSHDALIGPLTTTCSDIRSLVIRAAS